MDVFILMFLMVAICVSIYVGLNEISNRFKEINERIDKTEKAVDKLIKRRVHDEQRY